MEIIDDGIDPIGLALGFGEQAYHRFHSDNGIGGLAKWKWDGPNLEILAIHSEQPGSGQLREFIAWAKGQFSTITIWHISDQWLVDALTRYGFTPETDLSGNGEVLDGMRWDKTKD